VLHVVLIVDVGGMGYSLCVPICGSNSPSYQHRVWQRCAHRRR